MAQPMLRLEEAQGRMLAGVEPLGTVELPLLAARGLVAAHGVVSRHTLPPWDNSAMDGFAVRSMDVAGADAEGGVRLRVVGEAAAGRIATAAVESGEAVRILTGAPLPPGADAVVPVEQTDAAAGVAELPDQVVVARAAEPGAHVRRAGSDLQAGTRLIEPGTVVGPAEIALAAAGGHGTLRVHRRPVVAVLATGDELVDPGRPLDAAQIPDSNSAGLLAQAEEAGATALHLGIAGDRLGEVMERLREGIARADVVVVSGGVSVGAHDVVKDAFAELGRLDLWRVAVQPGKPLAYGRAARPSERGDVLLFGLPGNPVSSFVTFELFVVPVVHRLAGHTHPPAREMVRAVLAERVSKAHGRRAFLRVRLRRGEGGWHARLAGGQGSHVLSALAQADGLAVVPEEVDGLPAGAEVDVMLLRRVVA
jgi:molybdenum cofactor synthesis domain-containing protein